MAKKAENKELKLEDFFTNSINSTGSKLTLQIDGVDTEHFLMVKSIDCTEAFRERINVRAALPLIDEKTKDIENPEMRGYEVDRLQDEAYKPLAALLVSGWSFGELDTDDLRKLFDENIGLSFSVVAHASARQGLRKKK